MTWTTQPRSNIAGLAAIEAGQGAPIVLLHGVGLRAEAWAAQIPVLSKLGHVIAPDMLGHGENLLPENDPELEDFVRSILTLVNSLEEPCVLIGHSMGAMLALEVASRAPQKVQAVAALNAVFEREDAPTLAVRARADALDGVSETDPTVTLTRWFGDQSHAERRACEAWLRGVNPRAYKAAYTAFAYSNTPSRATLTALNCPAIFVTGKDEPNSTPAMSQAMADLAPNGRAIIVEDAAHMMPMTHPQPTNTALVDLINKARSQ